VRADEKHGKKDKENGNVDERNMKQNSKYTVYSDSPSLPEDIFIPEDRVQLPTFIVGVLYCVLWFAFYGLLVLLDRYIENPPRWLGWTATILVFVVPGILVHLMHKAIKDKTRAELLIVEKRKQAESLSSQLNVLLCPPPNSQRKQPNT